MYGIQTTWLSRPDKNQTIDSICESKEQAVENWRKRCTWEKKVNPDTHFAKYSMYVLVSAKMMKMVELIEFSASRFEKDYSKQSL